jgi:hypothetical protein
MSGRDYDVMRASSTAVTGAVILAALGCGSQPLGGAMGPPSGLGARGGGAAGKSGGSSGDGGASSGLAGAASGEGGSTGAGASTGTAGASSGEGGVSSGAAGGSVGGSGGVTGAGGFVGPYNNKVDILFMIDNSSEMTAMQNKLYDQTPNFIGVLENLPAKPDLHVAVVSSDMGAPGDATSSIGCTSRGDQGQFQSLERGTCTDSTLQNGAAFISDDGRGNADYTSPTGIDSVLQCIMLLGVKGCGFEHQLASIDRALGADGSGPPSTNGGFLRDEALLAIIILSNEDDCSAPASTGLYSLNGGEQNLSNPLGPVANYRCNQFGHLCTDLATNQVIAPPLVPPSDAQGTTEAPTLDLAYCTSNDTTGLLTPVAQFVSDIRALKPDPDNQIVVGAIIGLPAPYTVAWLPALGGQNTPPGELWPQIEHSCGPAGSVNPEVIGTSTDGSFGDPAVRISQFVLAFPKGHVGSICSPSYSSVLSGVASDINQLIEPPLPEVALELGR